MARLTDVRALCRRDPALAAVVARHGPPPEWARRGGFATLAKIILEQQVSLAAAATLFTKVARTLPGGWKVGAVRRVGERGLRARGLTRQKARYVVALARAVDADTLSFSALARLSDADARATLERVDGIGPWTSSIYLLMVLRRPDVWPRGDLALHKAMGEVLGIRTPSSHDAERVAERWAPLRATAARILWHHYLATRG